MQRVKAQRDAYIQAFDETKIARCDRVTFAALASAFGAHGDIAKFETEPGLWERDAQTCFKDGQDLGSKSECSLDGYLSVLHAALSMQDMSVPRRMFERLEARGWTCGEGPEAVTSIKPLKSTIERMIGARLGEDADATVTGFRGHLLASYILLQKRLRGSYTLAEKAALKVLYADVPTSPLYAALADDEAGAVRNLLSFPAPYSRFWGSAPDDVVFIVSTKILEGE